MAQEGTTLEEYRYLSKGYIYQLEMGLDAQKEGYTVRELFTASNQGDLVGLYKNGIQTPRALLVILEPGKAKTTYVCVPNGQSDPIVKKLADADQAKLSSVQQQQYQAALNEFLFAALSSSDTPVAALHQQAQNPLSYGSDESFFARSAPTEDPETTTKSSQNVVVPTTTDFQYTPEVKPLENPIAENKNIKTSKSSILGELSTRSIIQNDAPTHSTRNRGIVAIKICVDRNGDVKTAKFTQRGSTTFNSSLKAAALKAAKKIKFIKLDLAEQCGIVKYEFL
jgi:hypothetical protein